MLENRRMLSTVSWTSGSSGSWNTAADWSGGVVPAAGDDVVINQTPGVQVNLAGSAAVNSLTVTSGTLNLSGGTLSVANGVTVGSSGSITLPSGTAGSTVGTNLLSNAGFESPAAGTSSTTVPDVWGQWNSAYVSTAYAHSGSESLLESGSSGVQQSIAVAAGVTYSASVYALTPASNRITGDQGAFLQLVFTNASGGTLTAGQAWVTALSSSSMAGTWIKSSVNETAPAGAVSLIMYLQAGPYNGNTGTAGGLAYLDDAVLGPLAINGAALRAASVTNSGTINIGGGDVVSTTGAFAQTASGNLITQLGGPAAGGFYGSVTSGAPASLAGTFQCVVYGGYTPTISDGFSVITYPGESGSFSSVKLASASGYQFADTFSPTYFGISALPVTLSATVNAGTSIAASTNNLVGVNTAWWDDQLTTTQTQQMVQAAGLHLYRLPGGSSADDFHFNVAHNYSPYADTLPQMAQFVASVGGSGIVTTDYGSGSPQEAEAELAYLEGSTSDTTAIGNGIEWSDTGNAWTTINWKTVGYWAGLRAAQPLVTDDGLNFLRLGQTAPFTNFNYWEIGNEEYGSWEIDHHGTAGPGSVSTGAQHDPATYAAFTAAFAGFVKNDSLLPAVLTGIDTGDPTGTVASSWIGQVISNLHTDGFSPGFVSDHSYMYGPGSENDSLLLNGTVSGPGSVLNWSVRYADYEAMLQQVLGTTAAAGVKVLATEFNSNYGTEGKQMTSLVNGLFVADSIGSLLNSGYSGGLFWDLRNGWNTSGNNSAQLYGWRQGGDEGILGSSSYTSAPATGPYIPYPTYFAEQLASMIMQNGGAALPVASNYSELGVYAVLESNGHLDLMVLNKNPDAAITDQFSFTAFSPSGQAQIWQYGQAQDYAQSQSSNGASALANTSGSVQVTGGVLSYSFPAYSMTVIDLTSSSSSLIVPSGTKTITALPGTAINTQTFSSASVSAGAKLVLATSATTAGRTLLNVQSLTIAGSTGAWTGSLDLGNGDLIVQNGNLGTLTNSVAAGSATGGIFSSAATGDTTHLTTIGVISNNNAGGAIYNTTTPFDSVAPAINAVLLKYTYYGDANLTGKVDSADYTLIDAGYLSRGSLTGWYNGDFNYDGAINGSDYTLIDNAFNQQGASLADQIASGGKQNSFSKLDASVGASALPVPAEPRPAFPNRMDVAPGELAQAFFSQDDLRGRKRLAWPT